MQLWTCLAQQQQYQATYALQQQQQPASPSSPPLTGLAAGLRPYYFSSAAALRSPSATQTSSLSGRHHVMPSSLTSIYPMSPSTSRTSSPSPQQAALALMASQTLVQRLGSAFWQAFSGSSPPLRPTPAQVQVQARARRRARQLWMQRRSDVCWKARPLCASWTSSCHRLRKTARLRRRRRKRLRRCCRRVSVLRYVRLHGRRGSVCLRRACAH